MFKSKKFDYKKCLSKIIINRNDLRKLQKLGHMIGLHSHNHSTSFNQLNYKSQLKEYKTNLRILKKILKIDKIIAMSHPCGSYNKNTFKVLKKLKIEIGFKQVMTNKITNNFKYEICRNDHSNIIGLIK